MNGLLAPPAGAPPNGQPPNDSRAHVRGESPEAGGPESGAESPRRERRARGGSRAGDGEGARPGQAVRVRRVAAGAGVILALGAIASAGTWGPRALSRLAFFRVRRVEIDGARYAAPGALVARLGVDTAASVWTDLDALARRVAADPLVEGARVERRLPGVLRVVVRERVPVAQVPSGAHGALVLYDAAGVALPLAPARVGGVDVPLAASADPALLRALGALRSDAPRLYARVLEAARAPRAALAGPTPTLGGPAPGGPPPAESPEHDEFDLVLAPDAGPAGAGAGAGTLAGPPRAQPLLVRTAVDVTVSRFADLGPVEDDLTRRGVRASELDLRFRDQVIARLADAPGASGPAAGAVATVAGLAHSAGPRLAAAHVAAPHVAAPHVAAPHVAAPHVAAPHVAAPHVAVPRGPASRAPVSRGPAPPAAAPHRAAPHAGGRRPYVQHGAARHTARPPRPSRSSRSAPSARPPV